MGSDPIEVLLKRFIEDVRDGSKSNSAMHSILRGSHLAPERRSALIRACNGDLRYWYLISDEIRSEDPLQMAAAGMMLFTDWFPGGIGIPRERLSVIKERLNGSGTIRGAMGAKEAKQVPEKAALMSVPSFIKDHLYISYGETAREVLSDALLPPKYLGVRTNTLVMDRDGLASELNIEGVNATRSELDPDALLIPDGSAVDKLTAYRDGHMEVQDISSQIACRIALAGIEGKKVIDACAGNGGKTLSLAALMQNKGVLISIDPNERSLLRTRQRARRAQVWNYQRLHLKSEKDLDPYIGWADMVLVDGPCSGLGTMRRNPDIKLHLTQEQFRRFPDIQLPLLRTYSRLVAKSGRLVYSTCTLNPDENEKLIYRFNAEHPEFKIVPAKDLIPDLPRDLFRGPFFYPMPSEERSGFFAAIMKRNGN
jgi:16S rRNA (cytosine967-C5)-methyltransferase